MIKTTFKAHPLMIVSLMKPYLFVLILPLIRALIQYITSGQIDGLLNLEIIAFSFVLCISFLSYRSISITVCDRHLTVRRGVLIKSCAVIELSRLSSVALRRKPIDYLFGSVECAVNTEAGRPKKSDFAFKMYGSDANRLYEMVYGKEPRIVIKFSAARIAILAATTSSAFSGMLVGVPIVNQTGDLLGLALSDMFLNEINNLSERFAVVFPPIVNTVTIILLAGYGVSFLTSLLKNINFKLQSGKDEVDIRSGLIVRRRIAFKKSKVNNICLEQTPLMRIFKKFSMRASIGGYGDSRGEKAVVVPVASHSGLEKELKLHFPSFFVGANQLRPPRTKQNRNRFFFAPTIIFATVLLTSTILSVRFEHFSSLILFLTAVLLSVNLYYAFVCYRKYKYGSLCFENCVFASGFVGFNSRELYCDKGNVGIIKITQTPADRRYKTCKVKLTVRSENADSVRVNNLQLSSVAKLLKEAYRLQEIIF